MTPASQADHIMLHYILDCSPQNAADLWERYDGFYDQLMFQAEHKIGEHVLALDIADAQKITILDLAQNNIEQVYMNHLAQIDMVSTCHKVMEKARNLGEAFHEWIERRKKTFSTQEELEQVAQQFYSSQSSAIRREVTPKNLIYALYRHRSALFMNDVPSYLAKTLGEPDMAHKVFMEQEPVLATRYLRELHGMNTSTLNAVLFFKHVKLLFARLIAHEDLVIEQHIEENLIENTANWFMKEKVSGGPLSVQLTAKAIQQAMPIAIQYFRDQVQAMVHPANKEESVSEFTDREVLLQIISTLKEQPEERTKLPNKQLSIARSFTKRFKKAGLERTPEQIMELINAEDGLWNFLFGR